MTSGPANAGPAELPPPGPGRLRLLGYNVRSLRDDRHALVRVIRACAPDVVCVQESPRYWRPQGQAAWLARRTGTVVLAGGGRTAAGPLLLGRPGVEVLAVHDRLLPKTRGLHARGFAGAVVRVAGSVPFSVTACHLSLDPAERYGQFELLLDQLRIAGPGVVAGDFNEHPDGPGWRLLAGRLQDGYVAAPWGGEFTSVPENPYQRIDAVFATPGVRVLACGVPHGLPGVTEADLRAATDHLPVLAVLELPTG
ncbi:endonuclease/exonuclease/phosphatase family protein [Streptomyces sp. CB01881]|uniref:endonuclease/exonuclease/phosphatase family protein n=1 Tax=Streptomyces sp. CB01881 TaxID=2078691 RepID=UPI000CDC6F2A|nr:endonuclease/exonuclease/phosphatase family protein [Streptomyces sp. CB01881]AUY52108.1 endonuclease [Streptomyces sp. CB01881]TYC71536.1 endonuclease [Streptomyces sp. CB01881]